GRATGVGVFRDYYRCPGGAPSGMKIGGRVRAKQVGSQWRVRTRGLVGPEPPEGTIDCRSTTGSTNGRLLVSRWLRPGSCISSWRNDDGSRTRALLRVGHSQADHCGVLHRARPGWPSTQRGAHVGTMTADLEELADWLTSHGVSHVAMESTGIFWQPVYNVLEERFTLLLANA